MVLVNKPVPVPSSVLLPLMVGFADVLQQIPLAVIGAPPSEVTFPPLDALVEVIEDTVVVVTVGAVVDVVKVILLPYAVPALFAA